MVQGHTNDYCESIVELKMQNWIAVDTEILTHIMKKLRKLEERALPVHAVFREAAGKVVQSDHRCLGKVLEHDLRWSRSRLMMKDVIPEKSLSGPLHLE